MKEMILLLAAVMFFAFAGCGEQPAPDAAVETEVEVETGTETQSGQLGDTIVLPDGWAMNDAIAPAEVEAIMGTAGFGSFPEAASNAASGKPVGSYNIGSVPYSKVRFEVDVAGGRSGYDTAVSFLTNPVDVPGALWDAASIGDVPSADRMQVRFVGLRGNVCFHISWEPAVFPGLDKTETSVRLAELLVTNLYTQ
ncbi:MAG: hypothetical protein R6V62_02775 [Candidatus Fermentibacteraceae bacterium]